LNNNAEERLRYEDKLRLQHEIQRNILSAVCEHLSGWYDHKIISGIMREGFQLSWLLKT
jgi:hypothetical protein